MGGSPPEAEKQFQLAGDAYEYGSRRAAPRRRHVREQSIVDHVARDLFKPPPEPAAEKSERPKPMTDTGLSIEEQVRKEWDGSHGGLLTF